MVLAPGSRLGPYEVTALIGEGGMGKVWRAYHTGLKRDDALKVLPDAVATDPERVARFQREAQVLASLNHPNIAHVFGLEEADGITALVMELVEGPTLAARIARGPIPPDEVIPIARQIAEALEAAHERGIVHRDLKPENIKVRPDGMVKVLDFGLAKALEQKSASSIEATESPTITTPAMTQMGLIVGTAAYMSPEQARGRTVDRRADIWAFGCVLFEMFTGHRAFGGEDVTDTLAAVLRSEPRWETLPTAISPSLQVFLRRCLHKDSKQRLGDIRDVRLALEGAFEPAATETPAMVVPTLRFWQRPAAAAVVALSLMASTGLLVWKLTRPTPASLIRMTVALPPGETVPAGGDPDLAISPDGRRIVFVAGESSAHLYVRAIDQLDSHRLTGAESPRAPFMSPDGNWIAFFDLPALLKKVSVNGGPPVTIATLQGAPGATGGGPRGGSWGSDNTIIFATNDPTTGLLRVPAGGGEPQILTRPDPQKGEADHFWPEVLPGGHAVLFTIVRAGGSPFNTGRVLEDAQIAVLDLRTGEQRVVIQGGSYPRYMTSGHVVYGVSGTLRAVAFDVARLEVRSDPFPVLEGVDTTVTGGASFAVAQNGSLIYVQGAAQSNESERTLVWVDRKGHEETISAPPRAYLYPRISPDGTRVALDVRDQENDIWVWDFDRKTMTRLTFDPELDSFPAWTPDGKRIAFSTNRAGRGSVSWQAADGTGAVELLTESSRNQQTGFASTSQAPGSFSPDGRRLVFREIAPKTGYDIAVIALETPRGTTPLVQSTFTEYNPEVSPNGRWLAFESNESGQFEVYVRPFPDVASGRWQISTGGGRQPLWARSGRELFYVSIASAGRIMAVPIEPGPTFSAGNPQMIIDGPYAGSLSSGAAALSGRTYDVSRDGQRFLMIKGGATTEAAARTQFIVVQNWLEELKRLVPTK